MKAAALLVLLAATPAPAGDLASAWARIAASWRELVERQGIVGASATLVQDGAVVGRVHVGLQDEAARRPVDGDTIYHWASITKTFTGIAVLQLRDRGRLSLDDPVVRHVPELRRVHDPDGHLERLKVRHLMAHSGGFRASTWPWGGDESWHPYEPTDWDQLVAMLPYTKFLFEPGTRYAYSNPGVIFLGRIVEELSGDDYETYVTKNILMPLGMTRTFFDRAPYHLLPHRSHSYYRDEKGLREARFDFDTGITVSNGGLNAPLADMARYALFLLEGDERVLARASRDEMWTPQIAATAGEGTSAADTRAALSFFVERVSGLELVGHSGDQNGFIAHLYLHPPSRTGWVVAFNTNGPGTQAADDALRDAVVRELLAGR